MQSQPLSGNSGSSIYYHWSNQEHFLEFDFEDASGMNLHRHPHRSERTLVIFVHGFNGKGYGTWAEFPRLLFEDSHGFAADVAVFRYSTGYLAAVPFKRTVNLNATIRRLQRAINELAPHYSSIYLFCHSLGGIVGQIAVEQYLKNYLLDLHELNTKIAALFFFGSPRAGTRLAPAFLNGVFREFEYLTRFSDHLTDTELFYNSYVEMEPIASLGKKKFLIPRYVCAGSRDAVVEGFTATYGVPLDRIYDSDLNHKRMVKPMSDGAKQFVWALGKLQEVVTLRRSWMRERAFALEHANDASVHEVHYITELWPGTDGTEWALMFREVRRELSNLKTVTGQQVKIHDKEDLPGQSYPADLLISLHSAEGALQHKDTERAIVLEARRRHESVDEPTVGISPIGDLADAAKNEMESWLAPHRPFGQFFIEPAKDGEALKQLLYDWLKLIVGGGGSDRRKQQIAKPMDWPQLGNEGNL